MKSLMVNKNKTNKALLKKQEKEIKKCLSEDTRGLSTVEYLILLVLIAVASLTLWKKIGGKINDHATHADENLGDLRTTNGGTQY